MLLLFAPETSVFQIFGFYDIIFFLPFLSFLCYHVKTSMKESCVDFVINFPSPPTVSEIPNKGKKEKEKNT